MGRDARIGGGSVRQVRPAGAGDLPGILAAMDAARGIMRASGNLHQWSDAYPSSAAILSDIGRGAGFVITEDGSVVGYFAFIQSPEPTYAYIEGGSWIDDPRPYHVIHRIASFPEVHGIFDTIMDWAFTCDPNIRIDTHRDNRIMQHCLARHGFRYCGIIYLANGDERLAYQKLLDNSDYSHMPRCSRKRKPEPGARDLRVAEMSAAFDRLAEQAAALSSSLEGLEALLPEVKTLKDYQLSGEWLRDYEADERGEISREVNRSVLSQDGLYDLLADLDELRSRLEAAALSLSAK